MFEVLGFLIVMSVLSLIVLHENAPVCKFNITEYMSVVGVSFDQNSISSYV